MSKKLGVYYVSWKVHHLAEPAPAMGVDAYSFEDAKAKARLRSPEFKNRTDLRAALTTETGQYNEDGSRHGTYAEEGW